MTTSATNTGTGSTTKQSYNPSQGFLVANPKDIVNGKATEKKTRTGTHGNIDKLVGAVVPELVDSKVRPDINNVSQTVRALVKYFDELNKSVDNGLPSLDKVKENREALRDLRKSFEDLSLDISDEIHTKIKKGIRDGSIQPNKKTDARDKIEQQRDIATIDELASKTLNKNDEGKEVLTDNNPALFVSRLLSSSLRAAKKEDLESIKLAGIRNLTDEQIKLIESTETLKPEEIKLLKEKKKLNEELFKILKDNGNLSTGDLEALKDTMPLNDKDVAKAILAMELLDQTDDKNSIQKTPLTKESIVEIFGMKKSLDSTKGQVKEMLEENLEGLKKAEFKDEDKISKLENQLKNLMKAQDPASALRIANEIKGGEKLLWDDSDPRLWVIEQRVAGASNLDVLTRLESLEKGRPEFGILGNAKYIEEQGKLANKKAQTDAAFREQRTLIKDEQDKMVWVREMISKFRTQLTSLRKKRDLVIELASDMIIYSDAQDIKSRLKKQGGRQTGGQTLQDYLGFAGIDLDKLSDDGLQKLLGNRDREMADEIKALINEIAEFAAKDPETKENRKLTLSKKEAINATLGKGEKAIRDASKEVVEAAKKEASRLGAKKAGTDKELGILRESRKSQIDSAFFNAKETIERTIGKSVDLTDKEGNLDISFHARKTKKPKTGEMINLNEDIQRRVNNFKNLKSKGDFPSNTEEKLIPIDSKLFTKELSTVEFATEIGSLDYQTLQRIRNHIAIEANAHSYLGKEGEKIGGLIALKEGEIIREEFASKYDQTELEKAARSERIEALKEDKKSLEAKLPKLDEKLTPKNEAITKLTALVSKENPEDGLDAIKSALTKADASSDVLRVVIKTVETPKAKRYRQEKLSKEEREFIESKLALVKDRLNRIDPAKKPETSKASTIAEKSSEATTKVQATVVKNDYREKAENLLLSLNSKFKAKGKNDLPVPASMKVSIQKEIEKLGISKVNDIEELCAAAYKAFSEADPKTSKFTAGLTRTGRQRIASALNELAGAENHTNSGESPRSES